MSHRLRVSIKVASANVYIFKFYFAMFLQHFAMPDYTICFFGPNRFYKGLPPLWMRQIPYTMMKFACFERTVEALYKYVVPKPRADCTKGEQLVVTFAAGYIAGVFCAIVSHPADTVVSKLNNDVGSTPIQAARELGMKGK